MLVCGWVGALSNRGYIKGDSVYLSEPCILELEAGVHIAVKSHFSEKFAPRLLPLSGIHGVRHNEHRSTSYAPILGSLM